MQTPSYLPPISFLTRRRMANDHFQPQEPSFFDTHPVSDIVRSLIFATLQWGLLACIVYTVYTMVLGSH